METHEVAEMGGKQSDPEHKPKSQYTHQTSAEAEDRRVLRPGVDVSAEKAVSHVTLVMQVQVRVGVIERLRSQVCDAVRRGDEAGVCAQIQMKTFPECLKPVVNP